MDKSTAKRVHECYFKALQLIIDAEYTVARECPQESESLLAKDVLDRIESLSNRFYREWKGE